MCAYAHAAAGVDAGVVVVVADDVVAAAAAAVDAAVAEHVHARAPAH